MEQKKQVLADLVLMSNNLGKREEDLVIIGEGNTSAKIDKKTFFIKASGTSLETIKGEQFVEVDTDTILSALEKDPDQVNLATVYSQAKAVPAQDLKPSVETIFHAVCLSYEGINFVGHTHPTAVNILTCSKNFPENLKGRMYPDEIVVMGKKSIFIPYIDPGLPLAHEIKKKIDQFIKQNQELPKVIYLQNHGFIALGSTRKEVENITKTAVKAARVRAGAIANGGISLLSQEIIEHISVRPDEKYRQKFFKD